MLMTDLLTELKDITVKGIQVAENVFVTAPHGVLHFKESEKSWSVLECLEHLNLYSEFYNPYIKKAIQKGVLSKSLPGTTFKSGLLGDYFAKMMKIGNQGQIKKYPAFKSKNPSNFNLPANVLERFISQQKETLELLNMAENINLEEVKIPTTISTLIKLKLGDGFRFVIYHNERHVAQALRAFETGQKSVNVGRSVVSSASASK
jgi:hypothetical protein